MKTNLLRAIAAAYFLVASVVACGQQGGVGYTLPHILPPTPTPSPTPVASPIVGRGRQAGLPTKRGRRETALSDKWSLC